MGFITIGEFTVSKLKDTKTSYCCVLLMKMEARAYLLGEWLGDLNIPSMRKPVIRCKLGSFDATRQGLTPYDDSWTPDLRWQVGWPLSATMTVTFIEDMIYTIVFDGRYRDCVKTGSQIVDMMHYQSVHDRVQEIKDAISQEAVPVKVLDCSGNVVSAQDQNNDGANPTAGGSMSE